MNSDQNNHKITPYSTYIIVWIALLALTSITVTISGMDFGMTALFLALTIAAIKSALVIYVFMHIKYDEPIFKVFLAISFVTLAIIFLLTSFDVLNR
ncbi:MAG: cytochrome C oxidase subunit IV family protein [bacterium]